MSELKWIPAEHNKVSSKPGFTRGTPVSRLSPSLKEWKWLAVVFKDEEGCWFRAGTDGEETNPVYYGPYATVEEAQATATLMYRLGELE